MKKPTGFRVEYAYLKQAGLTEQQLDIYSNSDPLDIYKTGQNEYSLRGIVDADNWSIEDIAGLFDMLGSSEEDD